MRPTYLRAAAKQAQATNKLPPGFVPRKAAHPPSPPPATPKQVDPNGVRVGLRPPKTDRTRSLMDSFRALPSNTRIMVGIALGVVGLVGLYADRQIAPEEEGDAPLPISLRVVDRKE